MEGGGELHAMKAGKRVCMGFLFFFLENEREQNETELGNKTKMKKRTGHAFAAAASQGAVHQNL